jgi:CBS domain-containing protein
MKVGDIMRRTIVLVAPDAPIIEAATLMLKSRISGLPVINSTGTLVGIVTEGDFLRRTEIGAEIHRPRWLALFMDPAKAAEEYVRAHGRTVGDVMTRDVITARKDMLLSEAAGLMEQHHVKRLPVVDAGHVVGIVSRADLVHAVALLQTPPSTAKDESIQKKLQSELDNLSRNGVGDVQFLVHDAVVGLWGTVGSDIERRAICTAVENVPGVKKIQDHLMLIRPSDWVLGLAAPGQW